MKKNNNTRSKHTICVHEGLHNEGYRGINTPIYTSTSFGYLDTEERYYPRYFNIPNQKAVIEKVAALEHGENGVLFSSGMAAVSATLLSFLNSGDHCIFQHGLYGGTQHFVMKDFERFGIEYTLLKNNTVETFEKAIKNNTRVIYVETPSNPLLSIVDIARIGALCRAHKIISVIDNTFASPINQNPILLGIDVVVHSATKYLGGHSDICAGVVVSAQTHVDRILGTSMNFGGSLNAMMCYLLERSIKTLAIRVEKQNRNAGEIATFLHGLPQISKVFYPGLEDHAGHAIAKQQMMGFGGMLSFELEGQDINKFQKNLRLIKPSMSLGGVETIICAPVTTSHRLVPKKQREEDGIRDNLLRLSVGIEEPEEIIDDLRKALSQKD